MAEKEPKPRFKERKDRDDDDDDRPRRRSRDDDEDDDEGEGRGRRRARQRVVGSDRPPVLFLLGLIFGTVLLLGCCGVGGWGAYSVLVGGGGIGGGNEVEVTGATRLPGFGPSAAPLISWASVGKTNVADNSGTYFVVIKCGGKTHLEPFPTPIKSMVVTGNRQITEFSGLSGPVEVWVERRSNPNKGGTRVSNVYRVP